MPSAEEVSKIGLPFWSQLWCAIIQYSQSNLVHHPGKSAVCYCGWTTKAPADRSEHALTTHIESFLDTDWHPTWQQWQEIKNSNDAAFIARTSDTSHGVEGGNPNNSGIADPNNSVLVDIGFIQHMNTYTNQILQNFYADRMDQNYYAAGETTDHGYYDADKGHDKDGKGMDHGKGTKKGKSKGNKGRSSWDSHPVPYNKGFAHHSFAMGKKGGGGKKGWKRGGSKGGKRVLDV